MDFIILWTTCRILNVKVKLFRLILGSLCGALYSLVVLFYEGSIFTTLIAKVAFSVGIVLLTFSLPTIAVFLRTLIYFYLVSFVIGGTIIGVIFLADRSPGAIQAYNGSILLLSGFNYYWLLIGIGTALMIAYSGAAYIRRIMRERQLISTIAISFGGKVIRVDALMDTGNQLLDPLTKRPVIIVETGILTGHLPEEILEAVLFEDDPTFKGLTERVDSWWAARLHIIPYNSVGKARGIMLGVRPDHVEFSREGAAGKASEVIIGLVSRPLNKEGRYQALMHPDVRE